MQGDCAVEIPIKVYSDSKKLHRAVSTSALVEGFSFRLDLAILKESIERKEFEELVHIKGKRMVVIFLTKKAALLKALLKVRRKRVR